MNYIVLVKQVPDTNHIPRDAWDWESGTLKRALLENICNDLDRQALAFAVDLRRSWPGEIVALSMGPPFASEVLRQALGLGADHAVLLTDRKLGGADTAATAYPLAQAIRRIEKDFFQGSREYLIVAGMQSVDGDTAQVPPQVAEEMGIPQVAYVTGFEANQDGLLQLRRVTRNGTETIGVVNYPCLATMTSWTEPPFPTFARTRWALNREIHQWDAEAIQADKARIGLAGSRTNVVRIFPAKEASSRRCEMVGDLRKLVDLLRETYGTGKEDSAQTRTEDEYRVPGNKTPEYKGDLWILAEQEDGELHPAALELLGKARDLAAPLGEKVGAVLIGGKVGHLAPDLIAHGADRVFLIEDDRLARFVTGPCSRALIQLIDQHKPQMLLFSATPMGRELAPRVAYAVESGLTADCTDLRLTDLKKGAKERVGILLQTRPALGGNIMASIVSQNSQVQMTTIRPGVLRPLPRDSDRRGEVIPFQPFLNAHDVGLSILSMEKKPATVGLGGAEIVVAGGQGCRTKDNFDKYVGTLGEKLGKLLGGRVLTGATRQAVEAGFIDRSHQVGQTGQTIAPDLYVALGISGAVQHLSGVQGAGIVVAINKDANAPIFRACDFGVVGDLETVVPELVRLLPDSPNGADS